MVVGPLNYERQQSHTFGPELHNMISRTDGASFSVFTWFVLVNLVEKRIPESTVCKRMRFQAGQILAGRKSTGTLIHIPMEMLWFQYSF